MYIKRKLGKFIYNLIGKKLPYSYSKFSFGAKKSDSFVESLY